MARPPGWSTGVCSPPMKPQVSKSALGCAAWWKRSLFKSNLPLNPPVEAFMPIKLKRFCYALGCVVLGKGTRRFVSQCFCLRVNRTGCDLLYCSWGEASWHWKRHLLEGIRALITTVPGRGQSLSGGGRLRCSWSHSPGCAEGVERCLSG